MSELKPLCARLQRDFESGTWSSPLNALMFHFYSVIKEIDRNLDGEVLSVKYIEENAEEIERYAKELQLKA